MSENTTPTQAEIDAHRALLERQAGESGYRLNPDREFTNDLVRGLLINQSRYGYQACPCRLAAGEKEADLDLVCPCDYRDADLDEHGTCYCGLYVSQKSIETGRLPGPIPDRRLKKMAEKPARPLAALPPLSHPVWRCNVCGYLCARDNPPEVCPICKAERERFKRFI